MGELQSAVADLDYVAMMQFARSSKTAAVQNSAVPAPEIENEEPATIGPLNHGVVARHFIATKNNRVLCVPADAAIVFVEFEPALFVAGSQNQTWNLHAVSSLIPNERHSPSVAATAFGTTEAAISNRIWLGRGKQYEPSCLALGLHLTASVQQLCPCVVPSGTDMLVVPSLPM